LTVARRTLGRTALSVPEIGFGCGPTAGLIAAGDGDQQREAVARALALGIDYFDTAPLYGDGRSERTLGGILSDLRAAPLVATKVVLSERDLPNIRDAILRSVDASLDRLGLASITMLQLHNRIGDQRRRETHYGVGARLSADDVLGDGGVAETFAYLRAQGLVDYFACSAYGGEMSAVKRVIESGTFDCLSVHYSLLNSTAWMRPPEGSSVRDYDCIGARAAAAGMGVIVLRVLEAGLLAGSRVASPATRAGLGASMDERLDSLTALLEPASVSAPTALRYALSNSEVTSVLIGFSSAAQVESAVASAAEGPLPDDLLTRIEDWQENAP